MEHGRGIRRAFRAAFPHTIPILAGFLFGEAPGMLQLLGGAMIIGGVLYYSRLEREE